MTLTTEPATGQVPTEHHDATLAEQKKKRPVIVPLSGIRFLYALHVVVNHVAVVYVESARRAAANPEKAEEFQIWCKQGAPFFEDNYFGRNLMHGAVMDVTLFFVLSGFIMMYTYVGRDKQLAVSKRDFWIARFTRIYPVYALALFFTIPLLLIDLTTNPARMNLPDWEKWGIAAAVISLVQAWWPLAGNAWNPPAWSLSVEAFFYFLFPFFVPAFCAIPKRWILPAVGGFWLLSVIPASLYTMLDPDGLGHFDTMVQTGTWLNFMRYNPLVRLPEFCVGILLGRYYEERIDADRPHAAWKGAWLSVGAFVFSIVVSFLSDYIPYLPLHNGLMTPVYFAMLYGLILGGGPLHKLLSYRIMSLLGDSCYSLYILHVAVIAYSVVALVVSKRWQTTPLEFMIFCVVATVLVAVWNYTKFELPTQKKLRKRFASK